MAAQAAQGRLRPLGPITGDVVPLTGSGHLGSMVSRGVIDMFNHCEDETVTGVDLYWLPLGAGGHCVRLNGRVFEAFVAHREHRAPHDLYHSALQVTLHGDRYVVEMAPVWNTPDPERGSVCEGAVGRPWLGRFRLFRYEVRRWRNGRIPDVAEAMDSPQRLSWDEARAQRVLDLVPAFPSATWGADEQRAGDMWNSNSLIAWLLARSGHDMAAIRPPENGRAPGWSAGLVVATRQATDRPRNARNRPTQGRSGAIDDDYAAEM